jgi:anaerobic magnesium-protoporphyrin IX monomethyl ester cyclase
VDISRLDRELLVKMKKSGCYKLTFGIESASPATRKFIRKQHINLDKAKEVISYCNRLGIWTHSTFVIGFPYETENDIMKTIDYAATCGLDMATFYIACPYPGTELYDIYLKEGLFPEINLKTDTDWHSTINMPEYDTKYFTAAQLKKFQNFAIKKAYISAAVSLLNPFHLMPKILGRDKFRYFIRMIRIYYKMAKNVIRAGRNQGK